MRRLRPHFWFKHELALSPDVDRHTDPHLLIIIFSFSPVRSTRDSSCFTIVLNNLRVFLIFDWLQLVRDFLRMPTEKGADGAPRQRWPSGSSDTETTGAVMPKTVKSGVVTKRSTVPVMQDRYLEVKINVTGEELQQADSLAVSLCYTIDIQILASTDII